MPAQARVRVGQNADDVASIRAGDTPSDKVINCLEWCISDEVLNIADSASVRVPNVGGVNSTLLQVGEKIAIELSDPAVAGGMWCRAFTGRITSLDKICDTTSGSTIVVGACDLGWHLTSSHVKPHVSLLGVTWIGLLNFLIDPSWGLGPVVGDNVLNRSLKQGRVGAERRNSEANGGAKFGAILPPIQTQIGQCPWDIIEPYASREGLLVNITADGSIVFFTPDYAQVASYEVVLRSENDSSRDSNSVVGGASVRETIDGVYSSSRCWTTIINRISLNINEENVNAGSYSSLFVPDQNPLPFLRHQEFGDTEAVNKNMALVRAKWKWQMGLFDSWVYNVTLYGHAQNGHYFVTDTLCSVDDRINGVQGSYYVQSVKKSQTLSGGSKTELTLRRPGLLNPNLAQTDLGAGTRFSSQIPTPKP